MTAADTTTTVELRIDVTDAARLGEPAQVRASVVLPDPALLAGRAVVCFAKPGGGYSRGYYTCDLPGPAHGAQAAWHAARGWVFAALDTLGCGDSSRHDAEALDFATVTAAARAAEQEILLRLANGVLAPGYPPVHQPVVIGIGQSAGGIMAIYQQAHHRGYDGLAVLGASAVRSHPAMPPGEPPLVVGWYARDTRLGDGPLNAAELDAALAAGPQQAAWTALAWGFHYDDVPHAVVANDLAHYEAIAHGRDPGDGETPPWNSHATPGKVARSMLTPGVVAGEAAVIAVPVLSAMGVRDLVPDPPGEARAYLSARSFDLFICPRMGHMHNFAGTRELVWQRIHAFGEWCAAVKAAG